MANLAWRSLPPSVGAQRAGALLSRRRRVDERGSRARKQLPVRRCTSRAEGCQGHLLVRWPGRAFDVDSNGQRFLMLKADERAVVQIRVVLNWFEELKLLCPPGLTVTITRQPPCPDMGTRLVRRRAGSTRGWQHCPSRSRPTRAARTECARGWRCLCATPPQHLADQSFPRSPSRWRYRYHRPASPRGGACCTEAAGPC